MAIRVDTDGDGFWDLELDDPFLTLPSITDTTGDGILDVDISAKSSSAVIDDVIFRAVTSTNAGTGIYNTFLAIGDNDGNEAGFNSDDEPTLDDSNVNIDHAKTHTVLLANVPITVVDGQQYYEVRIDINDANNTPNALISLDSFQIYTSTDGSIVSYNQLKLEHKVFDIDDNGNITLLLSDAQSAGSGNDDYSILIPVSKFGNVDPATTYFYLFAEMGFTGGDYVAGSTFEEFNLQDAVTLTGHKFNDRDGFGDLDPGEEGIAGVTINIYRDQFIDENGNGVQDTKETGNGILDSADILQQSTVTDANGNYTFYGVAAGTYFIDEVIPPGSIQTTGEYETITISANQAGTHDTYVVDPIGNFNPIDISGKKFLDTNGDGLTVGDSGLGGVVIFIDKDDSGTLSAGDLSTVTAGDGTWSFTDLGNELIGKKVYEVLPDGYVQTLGVAGHTITGEATGLNFANFEKFDIRGTKYTDADGDGVVDAGESGLGGVVVFIDVDGSNSLSAGDLSTTTASDGTWSFTDLGTGLAGKKVFEVLPDGYVQTLGVAGHVITGTSGADQSGLNFANFEKFDIRGTKYTDHDGDGVIDAGESGLGGVVVFIDVDGSNSLSAGDLSTVTAGNGTWSFTDLGAGLAGKKVFEVLPDGYVQTLGVAGHTITGTSGADQSGLNFANFEKFDIRGTKYTDHDGDGVVDAGESGLGGVTIFIDVDGSGTLTAGDLSTVTAGNGTWSFTDLGAGLAGKKVFEVLPDGYVQTLGVAGHTITGTSGADQSGLNFANFEKFDIRGTKYTDHDGDGVVDAGESGLGGVTIFIDVDGSGTLTAGDLSTVTAGNGTWSFTDLGAGLAGKKVFEVLPDGYVQTLGVAGHTITGTSGADQSGLNFANFEKFDIRGTKYTDHDGDGVVDAGESGLGGVTIFIDVDGSGTLTAGDLSTVTAGNGTWSFTDLGAGLAGKKVFEVLPDGYVQTLGVAGHTITGTSGADQSGLNFANFEKFDIRGTKYTDHDGDGVVDAGESGLGGVTIFIDVDGSGTLTAGDLSTVTAGNGTWSFTDLGAGLAGKKVFEVLPDGYVQTLGVAGHTITGTSGADQSGLNFANFEKFDIRGTKYTDHDGDGVVDAGESGLGGVTIFIDVDGSGTLTAGDLSTVTAGNGTWSFTDLGAGLAGKKVFEVLPDGYVQTLGVAGHTITGTSGADQSGLNFANFETMDISGYKWADTDGGGTWNEGDGAVLSGWTIVLDNDADASNGYIATVVTDANGYYSFLDIGPDSYGGKIGADGDGVFHVYELQQNGFTQTYGGFSFSITSGLVIEGSLSTTEEGNFGNHMMAGANRTPGFWQSTLGKSLYDGNDTNNGDANGDGNPDGDKDFAKEGWSTTDLLTKYGIDTNGDGDNDTFIVYDADRDCEFDAGKDIFLNAEQLARWVGTTGDGLKMLERDIGATFLNTLNNASLTTPDATTGDKFTGEDALQGDIIDSFEAAVAFILKFDSDFNGAVPNSLKSAMKADYQAYGNAAHVELAAFNENGEAVIDGFKVQVLMDGDDYSSALVQGYLAASQII